MKNKMQKKNILALLLCVLMLFSETVPSLYVAAGSIDWSFADSDADQLSESDSEVVVTSIFPECTLTWTSFDDYLLEQATTAWDYPEHYVGYEVEFLPYWTSIECVSGFTGNENSVWVGLSSENVRSKNQINPDEFKMVIDSYHYDEATGYLWYKIKAAEGYVLPEVLEENPYVMYLDHASLQSAGAGTVLPTFIIGPTRAVFNSTATSVNIKLQPVAATREYTVDVSQLSPIFSVKPTYANYSYSGHYNIGDLASEYTSYQYVAEESITILPAEVSAAYEKLLAAEDTYEYYELIRQIPDETRALFSEHHRTALDECIAALEALEQVCYGTTVDFGGTDLPVAVVGKLPDNVKLQVTVVSGDVVLSEGFDVEEDLSDLIAALDIKLIHTDDGTEWQPKEGRRVAVSIGLGQLGYAEGAVVRLQHKHDDFIENYEIAVVQDGALTVSTSGFSIYAVNSVGTTNVNNATQIQNGGTIELEIAKNTNNEYVFYFRDNNNVGTWAVEDFTGALHYTVHSQTNAVGNTGVRAPWIRIHPLKVASGIKLSYAYINGNNERRETYTVNVVAPKADKDGRKLYIKDEVNQYGKIIAALTDDQGDEIEGGLEGAAFEWERSDGYLINPTTYGDNYASVNIARDHSGLVEARKENGVFVPTTYHLKVTMSDGEELFADYTVYYQSEIINSDFESPEIFQTDNYAFFPNGWPELYWKTTAPGANSMLTRDIEYGFPSRRNGSTSFGVTRAAAGDKMAELNAEDFGALYQDVISAPGEEVIWRFAHAPRQDQSWSGNTSNAMFIVLGPTETAQKLLKADLNALGAAAKAEAAKGANNAAFLAGTASVNVEYKGSVYTVWYHDAGTYGQNGTPSIYNQANNYGWTNLEGSYITPEGQYRTRLFFMSEEKTNSTSKSAGNLIDLAKGGQYRKYLIEYYTEILVGDTEVEVKNIKSVEGEALMHASVKLTELIDYMTRENNPYYLHKIMINGGNYPYNIRYEGDASLYIEKYEDAAGFNRAEYGDGDYYIVMQVYLREVATTVQTKLVFPEGMTDAQKLSVIQSFESGYQTQVNVLRDENALDIGTSQITNRDPSGAYTAYHYFNNNIYLTKGTTYNIVQTYSSEIPGLKLVSTTYYTYFYDKGVAKDPVISLGGSEILFNKDIGYAEVFIENKYEEKMTTIHYKAIGNGKVAFADGSGDDLEFMDTPTEPLAFYTGKAKGAKVYAGVGATFTGWFKDEACKIPVTEADGVWDRTDNSFRPNANIINADEITFYAKFETGSIVIKRENANPGQSFVYFIESASGVSMYVSLQCDENGVGQVVVLEAALGTYTVTELEDWSWRHDGTEQKKSHQGTDRELVFEFSGPVTEDKWLNACGKISSNTG